MAPSSVSETERYWRVPVTKNSDEPVSQQRETDNRGTTDTRRDTRSGDAGLFPVAPVWFSVGFYALLFVWAAYLLYETFSFAAFEDYALPFLLLPIVEFLVALKVFALLSPEKADRLRPSDRADATDDIKRRVERRSSETSTRTKAEREKYELIMLAWVIVLPIAMYVIGMGWSIVLYVMGFMWYFTRDVKLAVSTTIGVTAFVTVLFIFVLEMAIWTGILGLPDPLVYLNGQLEIALDRLFGIRSQ